MPLKMTVKEVELMVYFLIKQHKKLFRITLFSKKRFQRRKMQIFLFLMQKIPLWFDNKCSADLADTQKMRKYKKGIKFITCVRNTFKMQKRRDHQ